MRIDRRELGAAAGSAMLVGLLSRMKVVGHSEHSEATPNAEGEHMHESDASGTGTGAVFMEIANNGSESDVLVAGATDVADIVEIHMMEFKDDVMIMSELEDGLEIPAGESIQLESGGYHVMLINLTRDLNRGDSFELKLTFREAGDVNVPVIIDTIAPSSEAVTVGDIEISGVFARPAPMLGSDNTSTPMATPGQ